MSGGYLNKKKVEKLKVKFNLPDIYSACISNGDHALYIHMKDGSAFKVVNDELVKAHPWSFHTSDFNTPVPPKNLNP